MEARRLKLRALRLFSFLAIISPAIILAAGIFFLSREVDSPVFFSLLFRWPAAICSFECLGVAGSLPVIKNLLQLFVFSFLLFALFRAIAKTARRIKKTRVFVRRVTLAAEPRTDWGKTYYLFTHHLPLAFTSGWIRPKIYLSSSLISLLEPEELKAILFHEACHQRRRDPLRTLLSSFLTDFLFFLPLSQKIQQTLELTREVAADLYSLGAGTSLRSIACSLDKIFRLQPQWPPLSGVSPFGSDDYHRLRFHLEGRLGLKISLRQVLFSAVFFFLLLFLIFSPPRPEKINEFLQHRVSCPVETMTPLGG